jgi:dUTPase
MEVKTDANDHHHHGIQNLKRFSLIDEHNEEKVEVKLNFEGSNNFEINRHFRIAIWTYPRTRD